MKSPNLFSLSHISLDKTFFSIQEEKNFPGITLFRNFLFRDFLFLLEIFGLSLLAFHTSGNGSKEKK